MPWLFALALVVIFQSVKLFALRWIKKNHFDYLGVTTWVRQNRRYKALTFAYFVLMGLVVFLTAGTSDMFVFLGWLVAGVALFFLIVLALSWTLVWNQESRSALFSSSQPRS